MSRRRSSSPFGYRRPPSPSSSFSSSSFSHGRLIPRSVSSHSPFPRSSTPGRSRSVAHPGPTPAVLPFAEDLIAEDVSGSGESISVTIRFRPLSDREFQHGDEIAWYPDGDRIVRSEYNPAAAYAFDRVFDPATNSKVVYDVAARPVIKAAMEGINGTVFAYGVTSSGKTHTMHGDQNSPGIIPLAIKDVFSIIQDTPGREFLLRVSYIEIYNEVINDLLDPTGQNLRIREDAQGTYVEGVKEEVVLSPGHALSFIAAGEEHRHVGSNNFNLFSSRSHTIFSLMIESSARGDDYDGVIFSQLNLIDLAGSESSKTETIGLRRKEGSYINKSLLTLGTVIGKLSEGKASHIPYRDSKLTRLLQSSLSGHGHVSLICTVTPASSSLEETHNTLKFASRAKRVEIFASRNRIIDEKSLIKKYQREIHNLKCELDQLRRGMLTGLNQEEIMSLKQQLEEGQVKMQSRLEEEEEAKAALMSRIQRLTKLILVSSKNTIPGCLGDLSSHHGQHSLAEDNKSNVSDGSLHLEKVGTLKDSVSSAPSESMDLCDVKFQRSSINSNEENSSGSSITVSTQAGMTTSDQMDLLVEQVKMLAGEIAFKTSTLKRLAEQSVNDPEGSQIQMQNIELEIQEKKRQMRVLEQRIIESGEASLANTSMVDMQQTVTRLITQCNEKSFELEIKSADNRILQEQLQQKCSENKELQEELLLLQQQLTSVMGDKLQSSSAKCISEETFELKTKLRLKEAENEKISLEQLQLAEENRGLLIQNQKLAEEASYAKGLASSAAVELKSLAEEVTKLSLENERQAKELLIAEDRVYSRGGTGGIHKHFEDKTEGVKNGRKNRPSSRGGELRNAVYDAGECWNLDFDDMKMELQARKQREVSLEAALAEKEILEEEYKRRLDEAKKREATLENDLAGMWVLVARLKKGALDNSELHGDERSNTQLDLTSDQKENKVEYNDSLKEKREHSDTLLKERQVSNGLIKPASEQCDQRAVFEPVLTRLKAQIREMKEKELGSLDNGDSNAHVCKVCFESPTSAVLLPCRHFCLCKPCSFACAECPLCRTKIDDRIITFTS